MGRAPLAIIVLNRDGAYISGAVKQTALRRRFAVITRIVATTIVLILAFGAFWSDAMGAGRILNPFGILFLVLAGIVWFKWDLVRDAFGTAKNESAVPIIRLGSNLIKGISISQQPRSGRSASPDR
jgi:hypothetical protein